MLNFGNFRKSLVKNRKFFKKIIKYFALIILFIFAFSGYLRFIELNTNCEGFVSYYEFQDSFCSKSGFLNHKIECDLPVGVPLYCRADLGLFSFTVVKSSGNMDYIHDSNNNNDFYDFNYSFNLSI